MGILIPVLFVALFGVIFYVAHRMAEARRQELAALAARRGWRFSPDDDRAFPASVAGFDCFSRGSSQRIYNTLRGSTTTRLGPIALQAGDYRYTTGSGKNRHTHRLSYVVADLPLPVPPGVELVIRPEGFTDSIAAFVGFDDIDFESEEFSRRYFVKSNDRKFAYAVVHARMMEYLLASPCGHLQLRGARIVLCGTSRSTWEVAEFEQTFAWLGTFIDHWPDYLVSELRQKTS